MVCRFGRVAVAVWRRQNEVVDPALLSTYGRPRLAEVALRVSRWVFQRHEHLACMSPAFPDVVLDDGVAARKPVLVSQSLVDALGGVALLLRDVEIVLEYPVYDSGVRAYLGSSGEACVSGNRAERRT